MKKIGNFPDLLSDLLDKIFPFRVQFSDTATHQDAGRRLAGEAGGAGRGRRGRAAGDLAPGQRSGRGPRDQGQVPTQFSSSVFIFASSFFSRK